MNFEIDKKQIEIFYNETENKKIPVVILYIKEIVIAKDMQMNI